MRYRIAICDDSQADRSYLRALVSRWAEDAGYLVRTDEYPSAEAFLFEYEERRDVDILLLDIGMGGLNGMELAKRVRRDDELMQIVFVTGYSDYIAEGYEVSALHYLVKPVNQEKLTAVLDRAADKRKRGERCLLVETACGCVRVPLPEIRYLEVSRNYVTIYAKREYTVKRTLGELERQLDESFFRTGRSYIVNLAFVRRVTRTEAILSDGAAVPLSRGMYEPINRAIIGLN